MIVSVGGLFLTYATARYFQVQAAHLRGSFPVNRVGVMGVISASSILVAARLGIVLVPQGGALLGPPSGYHARWILLAWSGFRLYARLLGLPQFNCLLTGTCSRMHQHGWHP